MRDADIPLLERIKLAIERIANGQAPMRVPVEATDPDMVLADCAKRIAELEDQLRLANIDAAIANVEESDEVKAIMRKWAIESDESLTECVERNIDGWKQRCLRAEAERDALRAELEALRKRIVTAIVDQPCPTPAQWEQMQALAAKGEE